MSDKSEATTTSTAQLWVDVSCAPSYERFRPFIISLVVQIFGCIGVAYRVHICKMPAFVVLFVGALSGMLYLNAKALRKERSIKTFRSIYSLDFANVTTVAYAVGTDVKLTSSNYERLHFFPVRIWLMLLLWVAWILYGAVFHSGEHVHTEDELLRDLTGVGTETPHLLRVTRLYVLAVNAIAAIFYASRTLVKPSESLERGFSMLPGGSGVADDPTDRNSGGWPMFFTTVFFVLLFLPTPDSTPQALHPIQLLSRTLVFDALFLSSELFDRTLHYAFWLVSYTKSMADMLAGTQMALGRVVRKPLLTTGAGNGDHLDAIAPPPVALAEVFRSFSLVQTLSQWSIVVRSAWILVASAEVHYLALVQLLITAILVIRMRSSAIDAVLMKRELLRLNDGRNLPSTPPPSPTKSMTVIPVVPVAAAVPASPAPVATEKNRSSNNNNSKKKSSRSSRKKDRTSSRGSDDDDNNNNNEDDDDDDGNNNSHTADPDLADLLEGCRINDAIPRLSAVETNQPSPLARRSSNALQLSSTSTSTMTTTAAATSATVQAAPPLHQQQQQQQQQQRMQLPMTEQQQQLHLQRAFALMSDDPP
jgi:hypothetical protein